MRNLLKMRKILFLLVLIFVGINTFYGQTTITLNQPETGRKNHRANYNVKFKKGYHYEPTTTENLKGYIRGGYTGITPKTGLFAGGLGGGFDDKTIDTDLTVGKVQGSHGVTPIGGATYEVPIKLAPGRNGMAPRLSVNYSSQSGNGLLGMGWHLGGISVITRVPKTIYHDGLVAAVEVDYSSQTNGSDAFAMDGSRLIGTDGVYGDDGTVYATEQESFNKVTSEGNIGDGPSWFKVETKNGLTMEYGKSVDSKNFPDQHKKSVLAWYLNKVTDNNGNYYTYHYRVDNNEILLDEIAYGGNEVTGIAPFSSVKFNYKQRADRNFQDIADEVLYQNVVLNEVEVKTEGILVRKYNFNYGFDLYTYLIEVVETGSDNSSLNSTIFKYGTPSSSIEEKTDLALELKPNNASANGHRFLQGDYNGDGKTDLLGFSYGLVSLPTDIPGLPPYGRDWFEMDLFINDGDDKYTRTASIPFPSTFLASEDFYYNREYSKGQIGNASLNMVDFNGDGLSDLLFIIPDGTGNYIFYPYLSAGTTFTAQPSFTITSSGNGGLFTRTFDADGDGKTEIFVTYNTSGTTYAYELIFNLNRADPKSCVQGYSAVFQQKNAGYVPARPQEVGPYAPIRGESTGSQIWNPITQELEWGYWYTTNPAYTQALANWNALYLSGQVTTKYTDGTFQGLKYDFSNSYIMDHNGDGKYSLVNIKETRSNGDKIDISFDYNGTCFSKSENLKPVLGVGSITSLNDELFGDFNGDGRPDKIYTYPSTPWIGWSVQYSSLTQFTEVFNNNQLLNPYEQYINGQPSNTNKGIHYVADVNGDGKSDVIEFETAAKVVNVHYSNGIKFQKKSYPLSITIDHVQDEFIFGDFNGDGKTDLFIRQGKFDQKVAIIYFEKDSKERLLAGVKDGFNNNIEFEYDYLTNNSIYTKGTSSVFPVLDIQSPIAVVKALKVDDGIGGDVVTSYKYEGAKMHRNGKGFLGFSRITSDNSATKFTTYTTYELDLTYFINSPKTIYLAYTGGPIFNRTTFTYQYRSLFYKKRVHPLLIKTVKRNGLTNFTTTTNLEYDVYGNITLSNVQKGNIETIETTANYGQYGSLYRSRLVSSSTTKTRTGEPAYTRYSTFGYDQKGQLIQTVSDPGDAKELKTNYEYNPLGNRITEQVSGNGIATRAVSFKYDAYGRYIEETTNTLNQKSYTTYDARWGVPLAVTGVDGLVTKFEYDGFGTLISKTTPDGIKEDYTIGWDVVSGGTGNATTVNNSIYTNTTQVPGKPTTRTWHDSFGRERKKQIDGFNKKINTVTAYDERGNVKTTTSPFFSVPTTAIIVTTNTYNNLNRLVESKSNLRGTSSIKYTYTQNKVATEVTKLDGTKNTKVIDETGKLISSSENGGGALTYSYFSSGLEKDVKLNGAVVTNMEYDLQGNQTTLVDKNAGKITYAYNALGELIEQTDANSNTFQMTYDVLGRMTKKDDLTTNGATTYTYKQSGNGINQLEKVIENVHNISEEYDYDHFNRLKTFTETVDGRNYETKYTYDMYNNIKTMKYPSSLLVENNYNSFGYLTTVVNGSDVLWNATEMDVYNQYKNYTNGNGVSVERTYDAYGLPIGIFADKGSSNILNLAFVFDPQNGNLLSRKDATNGFLEEFSYDNLDRLTQTKLNGVAQLTMDYANNGNIKSKTDAGIYTYDVNKTNAVLTASNPHGEIGLGLQKIEYNTFNSPSKITEGNKELVLTYGPSEQRKKTVLTDGGNTTTTYFLGNYERIVDGSSGDVTELTYVAGGDGLTAISKMVNGGTPKMYYTYKDHLGSILKVTDATGAIVGEQNFDAWGRHRDPNTWKKPLAGVTLPKVDWLTRGYTGHEHLSEFDLINMNGRVYDPILARMLSPDNFVQEPTSTQSYNRFSYVMNNPLKYTDPSGELFDSWYDWLNPINYFSAGIEYINNKTTKQREWAVKNGVPEFNVGVGVSSIGQISAGVNGNMVNLNSSASVPAINFELVDKLRFGGPVYELPSIASINPDLHYERSSIQQQQSNGGTDLQVKATRAFLIDAGFPADQVNKDVVAQKHPIFGNYYAKLNNPENYLSIFRSGNYDSYSGTKDAYKSGYLSVGEGRFSLKYYPSRGNSLGIIQSGLGHYFEAAFEGFDGYMRDNKGFKDNTFYHMHEGNALYYLNNR